MKRLSDMIYFVCRVWVQIQLGNRFFLLKFSGTHWESIKAGGRLLAQTLSVSGNRTEKAAIPE
ncbi:hypothetical protein LEMLEM_LOCUS27065 [Lemmus lemmus]